MKKLLLFLIFLPCIAMSGERIKDISINFNKDDFSILVENNIAHISTIKYLYSYENDILYPALPKVCINVLISPDEELLDFSYTKTEQKILDNIYIAPCPEILPNNVPSKQHYNTDTIVSYTQDIYPQTFVKYVGSYIINGYKILSFDICPFRYDNTNKNLYIEQNYSFNISLNKCTSKRDIKIRQNDEAIIRNIIINPEDIRLYDNYRVLNRSSMQTIPQYEYAIITNNNLKPTFQKLANWKTLKGVRTKVLTIEEIENAIQDSCSLQMKIKKTLNELYEANINFKYALLAGDVDIVPTQMCPVTAYENISVNCPTDLYYAAFTTMDWDLNKNGISGELSDTINLSQDIAITRAPVSTIDEAEAFVNKILSYESAPNIQTWSSNILMCGCKIYNVFDYYKNNVFMSDSHYLGNKLYDEYLSQYLSIDGITRVAFYDTGTDFEEKDEYDFIAPNIQKELSKGYTFVYEDSHGSPTEWQSTEGPSYSVSYADTLNNSNHTIIVSSACLTNAFDSIPKCLSEAFIRNANSGVVAYVGFSRTAWYETKFKIGPSDWLNAYLYMQIFTNTQKNYGEMARKVKAIITARCYNYTLPDRWMLFSFNPIGDPEMPIYTIKPKKFSNVSIKFSNDSLIIDTGERDCRICVASANDIGASFYNVSTGSNVLFSNLTDNYSICITKPGFVPYIARCGNTVYMQNEFVNTDYEVISNQTIVGNNATTDKPNGPIVINKGHTYMKSTNGVTINDSFEVNKGASLEIQAN